MLLLLSISSMTLQTFCLHQFILQYYNESDLSLWKSSAAKSGSALSPFQTLRALVQGYMVGCDGSDHHIADNAFLLPE